MQMKQFQLRHQRTSYQLRHYHRLLIYNVSSISITIARGNAAISFPLNAITTVEQKIEYFNSNESGNP